MIKRTGNPTLNSKTFQQWETGDSTGLSTGGESQIASGEVMTLQGAVNKSFILTAILVAAAAWTWRIFFTTHSVEAVLPWLWAGTICGLIVAIATVIKKEWAPLTAPGYAVFEGFALGALSAIFEAKCPGIVIQSVALTLGTLVALLCAYSSRLIQATENFKLGVVAATGGIALVYLIDIGLSFFGHVHVPFIHESSPVGIGVSIFIVIIAALNLVLDFDFIETGARVRAAKYMEWYAAFGLMVTLVWLYLEILRLLAKSRRR